MKQNEFHSLWSQSSNWTLNIFYHCKNDPRVVVSKRWGSIGKTVNFSSPMAFPLIAITLLIAICPISIAKTFYAPTEMNQWLIIAGEITAIVVIWESLAKNYKALQSDVKPGPIARKVLKVLALCYGVAFLIFFSWLATQMNGPDKIIVIVVILLIAVPFLIRSWRLN